MRGVHQLIILVVLLALFVVPLIVAQDDEGEIVLDFGSGTSGVETEDFTSSVDIGGSSEEPAEIPQESLPPEITFTQPEEGPAEVDVTGMQEESGDVEFSGTTVPDYKWETNEGAFSDFSLTNALFAAGSLIQGSFVSFDNNNNLFFGSIFDDSAFEATLDEGSAIDVAQKNSIGETGKVHITMDDGNLTQDEAIVFIPDGDTPTYIYYNTTEVEFEDGTVELLGESVTNSDLTKDSTTIAFDENGFTRIQLLPDNNYTSFDYKIQNTNTEELIICKNDPLCDINIQDAQFTIRGKINLSFQEEVIYAAIDPNNIATFDIATGNFILTNTKTRNEIISYTYTGNHKIIETEDSIFNAPSKKENPTAIKTYQSILQNKTITLNDNTIIFTNYKSYTPGTRAESDCLEQNGYC